jgi:acetyl esterase/lipase
MHDRGFINSWIGVLLLVAIALSACAPQPAPPPTLQLTQEPTSAPTPKPEAVAGKLVEALNARDVEDALALFAQDAVVRDVDLTPYTGTAEIRGWLEKLADANFMVEVETLKINGDTVVEQETVSMDPWKVNPWKGIGLTSIQGVRKIKVRDGLIQSIEFSLSEASLDYLKTARLNATYPTQADLAYGKDSPEQVLDLYLPQTGNSPFPVILVIPNGIGKNNFSGMAGFFNQAGFAAVLIGYREQAQMMSDALCALAWTKANAGEYGLDSNRITVFGYFEGSSIAAMLGTLDDRSETLQGCEYPLPDQGGILGVAVYGGYLYTPDGCLSAISCQESVAWQMGKSFSELQTAFKRLSATKPAKWKDASAIGPQADALARQLPLFWLDGSEPPFLVMTGDDREDRVLRIDSEAFVKWLQDAGVDVQLLELETADHYSVYTGDNGFYDIVGAVVQFAGKLDRK